MDAQGFGAKLCGRMIQHEQVARLSSRQQRLVQVLERLRLLDPPRQAALQVLDKHEGIAARAAKVVVLQQGVDACRDGHCALCAARDQPASVYRASAYREMLEHRRVPTLAEAIWAIPKFADKDMAGFHVAQE